MFIFKQLIIDFIKKYIYPQLHTRIRKYAEKDLFYIFVKFKMCLLEERCFITILIKHFNLEFTCMHTETYKGQNELENSYYNA